MAETIREIAVEVYEPAIINNSATNATGSTTFDSLGYWYHPTTFSPTYTYSWPQTVYMYQIKCPVRACKKMNWLKLDTITPCNKCGAKLKAVSQVADFEIPIE